MGPLVFLNEEQLETLWRYSDPTPVIQLLTYTMQYIKYSDPLVLL